MNVHLAMRLFMMIVVVLMIFFFRVSCTQSPQNRNRINDFLEHCADKGRNNARTCDQHQTDADEDADQNRLTSNAHGILRNYDGFGNF